MEGTLTGTYSTRPSSTILEILTPERDAESSEDGLMPPTAYHCPCESMIALRRSTAQFTQAQTAATTCERDVDSTWRQGSKTALLVCFSEWSFSESFCEWSADCSRSPARKAEHHALHLRRSPHTLY